MSNDRYQEMFARASSQNRGVFIPFVVVGDPDMETSIAIMKTLVEAGADALELGIPFSDPVADGPTIQTAVVRALDKGATPDTCLGAIGQIREAFPQIPIGILTYVNTVLSKGMDSWFQRVSQAGIDSVLAADMPVFEAEEYVSTAKKHGVHPVFIAPPNADERTMGTISQMTSGYTYVVARKGVTGADEEIQTDFKSVIDQLNSNGAPPGVVGFGISNPSHIKSVIQAGAKGAISGSAVVRIIEEYAQNPAGMKTALASFVTQMKASTVR